MLNDYLRSDRDGQPIAIECSRSYTYGMDTLQVGKQKSCEVSGTGSPGVGASEGAPGFVFGNTRGTKSAPGSPYVKRVYRLVMVGSAQTGKTAILERFLNQKFSDTYIPTIENFHRKIYKIKGEHYQLDILDIGGNDPFPAARRLTLLNGHLFVVVCAMDRLESFEEAIRLRSELQELKAPQTPVPIIIALNKVDLPPFQHAISLKDAINTVGQFEESGFVHCSAKAGHGIQELFAQLFHLGHLPKQMSPYHYRNPPPQPSSLPQIGKETSGIGGEEEIQTPVDDSPIAETKTRLRVSRLRKSVRAKFAEKEEAECYDEECARRPSLRSDLLALRSRTSAPLFVEPRMGEESSKKKCLIQ